MLRKLYRNLEEVLGSTLLVLMAVVAVLQVGSRYVAKAGYALAPEWAGQLQLKPFSWTQELCAFLFVWMTFIGASLALKTQDHFAVDLLVRKVPGLAGKFLRAFAALLVVVFALLLLVLGWRYMLDGRENITPALEISWSWPYAALPLGGLLLLLRAVELLIKVFRPDRAAPPHTPPDTDMIEPPAVDKGPQP